MPSYRVATGWKVLCVSSIPNWPGAAAITMSDKKTILIKTDMTEVQVRGVIGHEYAHAEASTFTAATQARFTKDIKAPYRWGPDYYKQAGELYAENRAMCTGWRKKEEMAKEWRKLDCKVVNAVATNNR